MFSVTNLSRQGSLARTRQNHTRASVEVKSDLDRRAECAGQERFDGRMLASPCFQRDQTAWREQIPASRDDFAIGRQTVLAAIQGQARIVIANLRWEVSDFAAHDIRRIGDDHVERTTQGPGPIALDNQPALREPQRGEIFARDHAGATRNIDAGAERSWQALQ